MEHFQVSEVQFNQHSGFVESILPIRDQFFHVGFWFGEEDSFVFDGEVFFQIFRDVSCIYYEDTDHLFVHFLECLSVITVACSESDTENISFQIGRDTHFKPIIEAFSGMSPR